MTRYTITDTSYNVTYECGDDELILDCAEDNGLDYPYSDRAGASSSSAALLLSGTVLDEGTFLSDEARRAGFFHTDSSYPMSDIEIASLGVETLAIDYMHNPEGWIIDYSGEQNVLKPR